VSDRQRILVVTGSRAFEADDRSRAWARRAMLGAFHLVGPSIVVHGGAPGWDLYAEHLATWLGLPRIVFALGPRQLIAEPRIHLPGGAFRAVKDGKRYGYSAPLPRNEAMMRWAADQLATGHHVDVVAARAPWSSTGGTLDAVKHARAFELPTRELEVPSEAWPAGSDEGT